MDDQKAKFKLLLVLFLLGFLSVSGQDKSFTLKEAQDYAVQNNYQVRNAIIDIEIAQKKVRETLATGLPQVSASLSYNNFIDLATQLIPAEFFGGQPGEFAEIQFGTKHNATFKAGLSQLVFSGSYIVGLQASKAYLETSKLQLRQVEIDIKKAIASAYYMVLVAEEGLNIMDASLGNMKKMLEETEAYYKQGFMEDTDVDQIKLLMADLEANRIMMKKQLENAYNFLKFNMGIKIEDKIQVEDDIEFLIKEINPLILGNEPFDINRHISYQVINAQERISHLNLKLNRAAYYPTVSAFLSRQENAMRNSFNFTNPDEKWFPTTLFGVQVDIPVFSSGMRMAKVQQARLNVDKMNTTRQQVEQSLYLEVSTARMNFNNAFRTYQSKKSNLSLAERIYQKTSIKYGKGMASSSEVQQAYNQVLDAQNTYLNTVFELLNSKTALDKAFNKL